MLKRYCDLSGADITHETYYVLKVEDPFGKPAMTPKEISPAVKVKLDKILLDLVQTPAEEIHGCCQSQ